jgi:hypothetical protein
MVLIVHYSEQILLQLFLKKLVILIQAVIAYFAIKDFRKRYFEDEFSIGDGMFCGLLITVFSSVFSGG